ncbi:MFS transporter [Hydrogenophaga crassostreae]|uniref:MFS transporter n=1 Tax=Hydrogenophaga crassostreae TaxID=1763535 RepID=A0A162W5D7_9BURK|nr:MFS transporter [Hydrogenophaga crassostreae]AOW14051.1 MFS transporter [Hydrogenophaga crassostreae]OAD43986.1 MFS transporter [Hydrogenophaga crassostreae]
MTPPPASNALTTTQYPGRAMLAMATGAFAIGTGEFVIMGLLPEVAADIGVSIPQAGHVISAYAMGVVIGAPVLAVAAAAWGRRTLMMALLLAFAMGNFASATAPGYLSLSVLRFVTGMPHGTYFGVAALVTAALAPPGQRARAVGLVMTGLTVATLLGVPLAAWLGQHFGWRSAFVLVGAIALLAVFLIHRHVPEIAAPANASPLGELSALRNKQVWLTLGIAAIGFGGLFAVFSYVKPTMIEAAGLPLGGVPVMLALFGLGMVVGNVLGSRLADRHLMRTVGGMLVWSIVVLLAYSFTAHHVVAGAINLFLIGTTVAICPALQIRLMDVAGEAQVMAAALNHSAFNVANALGAWLGGAAISAGMGWTSTGWVGALLAVAGLAIFGWAYAESKKHPAPGKPGPVPIA